MAKSYDISDAEESLLPLPKNWIRIADSSGRTAYKDVSVGAESDEHPLILQALNDARKLPLPSNWSVQEAMSETGSTDYFYYNALNGACGWDPPHLRPCLSSLLRRLNYVYCSEAILTPHQLGSATVTDEQNYENEHCVHSDNANEDFLASSVASVRDVSRVSIMQSSQAGGQDEDCSQESIKISQSTPAVHTSAEPKAVMGVDWSTLMQQMTVLDEDEQDNEKDEPYPPLPPDDESIGVTYSRGSPSITSRKSKRSQTWQFLNESARKSKAVMRGGGAELVSEFSVRHAASTLRESNANVHVELLNLRMNLASLRGFKVSVLTESNCTEEEKDFLDTAGSFVGLTRTSPMTKALASPTAEAVHQ